MGVRDALDILSFPGIRIASRGDIGRRNENGQAKKLQILANKARAMPIGCVLIQTSYPMALAFSPVGVLTIFDSHRHHEHRALIAGVCQKTSPFKELPAFLAQVVGKIWDGHLCILVL